MIHLDLLPLQSHLRLSKQGDQTFVYDPIRRKEIVLIPEELVRQLILCHLVEQKQYPVNRIRVEIGIELNGLQKRCDIVVYDAAIQPWLVVECKSPKVPVNQKVFDQVARYNLRLQAPFVAVTNGLSTWCARLDFEEKSFEYLPDLPDFPFNT